MNSHGSATIHFFGGVKPLTLICVRSPDIATFEDVLMKCLEHVKSECSSGSYKWDLALHLPAFGLVKLPDEIVWIPTWKPFTLQSDQEFRFRVRFRPPAKQFKRENFMCDYLFVQVVHDFLANKNKMAENCNYSQLMSVLTFILFLPTQLPFQFGQNIDHTFKKPSLHWFSFKNRVVSPAIRHALTKESIFDKYWIPKILNDNFKELKKKGLFLAKVQEKVYEMIIELHPKYCLEVYACLSEEIPDGSLERNKPVSAHLDPYKEGRSKDLPPGFYYDEKFVLGLTDIDRLELKPSVNDQAREFMVVMCSKNCPFKPVKLVFKEEDMAESFISMIQGYLRLCVHYDEVVVKRVEEMSTYSVWIKLKSFGPLEEEDAKQKLSNSEGHGLHLICQSPSEQHHYKVHALVKDGTAVNGAGDSAGRASNATGQPREDESGSTDDTETTIRTLDLKVLDWQYTLDGQEPFASAKELRTYLNGEFGIQLLPRKNNQIASINSMFMSSEPIEPYIISDFEEPENSLPPIFIKEDLKKSSRIKDKNPGVKKWEVTIQGHQTPVDKLMLVELIDKKCLEGFRDGLGTLHKLGRRNPDKFLKVFGSPLDCPNSIVLELPKKDLLSHIVDTKARLKDIVCYGYQIISILEVMEKTKIFHGNLSCRKFMVCDRDRIKLADPGIGYFMDTLDAKDELNIQRLPWLAPERRKDLSIKNYETECYAIGTTFCEMLYKNDVFENPQSDKDHKDDKAVKKEQEPCLQTRDQQKEEEEKRTFQHVPKPAFIESTDLIDTARGIVESLWDIICDCWNERIPVDKIRKRFNDLYTLSRDLNDETCTEVQKRLDYLEETDEIKASKITKKERDTLLNVSNRISKDNIVKGRPLGGGHFGEVFEGTYKEPLLREGEQTHERRVALKYLKEMNTSGDDSFFKELKIARKMKHENLVELIGFTYDPSGGKTSNFNTLVMEYMNVGRLDRYLQIKAKEWNPVPDTTKRKICVDTIKGMRYLSEKQVVHRDLACRNILLCGSATNPVAKVSDFGLARNNEYHYNFYRTNNQDTLPYFWMPPEYNEKFTTKSDVWAFGVVMWEVFTNGHHPSKGYWEVLGKEPSDGVLFPRLKDGIRLPFRSGIPGDMYNVMTICWNLEPDNRPFFADLEKMMTKRK